MRILVVNPFGIGDVLFTLPLLAALRRSSGTSFLGFIGNRRTEELTASFPVDWHLSFEKDEFRADWRRSPRAGVRHLQKVVQSVRRERFDLLVDLSLGWQVGFLAWCAGIPERVGFNCHRRGKFLTKSLTLSGFSSKPVAEYYLDLLALLNMPKPQERALLFRLPEKADLLAQSYLESIGVSDQERLIGVVPGGGASWGPWAHMKRWPVERYGAVVQQLLHQKSGKVVVIGGTEEAALCRSLAQSSSIPIHLAIQVPSLLLLAGILKRCHLVIGNDSGPLHLAAAMGTRTVTLFGPVDGSVYGPFPASPLHRIVSRGLACRPCYQNFRLPPCPWNNACLKELPASQVLQAAEALL